MIMGTHLKAADAVWVATALLQRSAPESEFAVPEIVDRVLEEKLTDRPRPTVYLHANQHCVANRPPNAARLRMLVETASGNRRLFHQGDHYHPLRENARILPASNDIPHRFRPLLDWYREWSASHARPLEETDPLLALRGTGKHLFQHESGDEFLAKFRAEWGGIE
jgi:hypothetical protein